MNLLKETLEAIELSGHTPADIVFIGSEKTGHSCTFAEFEKIADVNYDSGFGSQKVARDLIIVFTDGQKMWRGEYDGSEWWNYSEPFVMPLEHKPIKSVIVKPEDIGWVTVAECNED